MQTAPTTSPKTDLSDVTLEGAPGGARKEEARQRVFDTAARTIYAQGGPSSTRDGGCSYRSANGRRCNVGALIPDEIYTPAMEGMCPGFSSFDPLAEMIMGDASHASHEFLSRLQGAHDYADDAYTAADPGPFFAAYHLRMGQVARDFGLSTAVLDTLQSGQE